jgi:hypothetical protein
MSQPCFEQAVCRTHGSIAGPTIGDQLKQTYHKDLPQVPSRNDTAFAVRRFPATFEWRFAHKTTCCDQINFGIARQSIGPQWNYHLKFVSRDRQIHRPASVTQFKTSPLCFIRKSGQYSHMQCCHKQILTRSAIRFLLHLSSLLTASLVNPSHVRQSLEHLCKGYGCTYLSTQ